MLRTTTSMKCHPARANSSPTQGCQNSRRRAFSLCAADLGARLSRNGELYETLLRFEDQGNDP